jgi:hypothetical protein
MRRYSSSQVGSYVLELAFVIMGVSFFIVGAADITRVFQARSAVRAAVNDGARCIFPTDSACRAHGAGEISPPRPTFDVWVWGKGYEVPQESFVVSAQWRVEPVYEIPTLQDEVASITVERPQFQYRQYSVSYPVTAHTAYLQQTRFLPVVIGGRPLEPKFADPLTNSASRPTASYGIQSVTGSTTRGARGPLHGPHSDNLKIGSISFSVRDAWPSMEEDTKQIAAMPSQVATSLPCLYGSRQESSWGEGLNWSAGTPWECRYRVRSSRASPVMRGGTLKVPMMFRVEGNSRGTAEGAEGKVMMALSWRSPSMGSGRVELGGRVVGHWGGGNFIPRGLAEVDIDPVLRSQYADYKEELSLYHELPLLPVDATVTLDFYLVSFNGRRVAWNGGTLEVWLPQYRLVQERHECGYASDPSVCSQPPAAGPIHYLSLSNRQPFQAMASGTDRCALEEDISAERDIATVIARLSNEYARKGTVDPYSFHVKVPTTQLICPPKIETKPCSIELPEYFEGCQVSMTREEIAARCGALSHVEQVRAFTTRPLSRASRRVRACSDGALPQCAMPNARKVESVIYEGESACEAGQISNGPQMVIGPLDVTMCHTREEDAQRLYRVRQKIPMEVPISVVRLPTISRFSADPPTSSCVPYHSVQGDAREMTCGRGLSAAAAERCCAASGGRCRKQLVVTPSEPSRDSEREELLVAAQRRVIEAVRAGYPSARYQEMCGDSERDCLEVSTSLADNDSKAIVSAKVRVPLMLLRPSMSDVMAVEHSTTRALERF